MGWWVEGRGEVVCALRGVAQLAMQGDRNMDELSIRTYASGQFIFSKRGESSSIGDYVLRIMVP